MGGVGETPKTTDFNTMLLACCFYCESSIKRRIPVSLMWGYADPVKLTKFPLQISMGDWDLNHLTAFFNITFVKGVFSVWFCSHCQIISVITLEWIKLWHLGLSRNCPNILLHGHTSKYKIDFCRLWQRNTSQMSTMLNTQLQLNLFPSHYLMRQYPQHRPRFPE